MLEAGGIGLAKPPFAIADESPNFRHGAGARRERPLRVAGSWQDPADRQCRVGEGCAPIESERTNSDKDNERDGRALTDPNISRSD